MKIVNTDSRLLKRIKDPIRIAELIVQAIKVQMLFFW